MVVVVIVVVGLLERYKWLIKITKTCAYCSVSVRVHAELETESDVNEVENELITKFTKMLGDRSLEDSTRILPWNALNYV